MSGAPYLLFDMAGTVFSSPVDWERESRAGASALAEWLRKPEIVEPLLDEGKKRRRLAKETRAEYVLEELIREVVDQFGRQLSDEELQEAVEIYEGPEMAITRPFEGAREFLIEARREGYELALLSNTPAKTFVFGSLQVAGMENVFDPIIISAEVGYRKPHERFLEAVREQVDFDPERSMLIGDRLYDDIGTAKALGVRGVLMSAHDHPDNEKYANAIMPEAEVRSFAELSTLVTVAV